MFFSNIKYKGHGFWLVFLHQLGIKVIVGTKFLWSLASIYTCRSGDQTSIRFGGSSWWFKLWTSNTVWHGWCDQNNRNLNWERTQWNATCSIVLIPRTVHVCKWPVWANFIWVKTWQNGFATQGFCHLMTI